VLTVLRGPETVRQAMLAGAAGYVIKGAYSRDLVDAIHAVARGERYLHSSVTAAIVDDSIRWQREGEPVSVREREVLSLLAEGKSTQAVSETLGISAHTVRRHVANLSAKLGVRGGAALTLYAIQHGFVRDR
jgi:two-component system nitrate/nitrite response regulator NarL